jgi:hypothetical protein
MDTALDLDNATAITAPGQANAAAAVRVNLSPHGFSIDHPDSELVARFI